MKINKQTLALSLFISSSALFGQAYAESHSKMEKTNSSFSSSVEYGKYRDAKSTYKVRASELIGETVERPDGENIGEIDDLVYSDTDNKLVAIISVGGFLGMGEKLVAVPYKDLRVTPDGDDVYLDSSEEALKSQATFTYNEGETTGEMMRKQRLEMAANNRRMMYENAVMYDKRRDDNSIYHVRASELIGETVEHSDGDNIGEIDDLVYAGADQELMAVISVGGFLGMGEKLVAVPYQELRVSADGDDVYLDSSEEILKTQAEFKYNEGETSGKQMRISRGKAQDQARNSKFADSVEYGKYRDAKSPYQIRTSEIIGETVEKSDGDNIGEVDDVVFSRADKKLMAIISVGGFLGIGDKHVAIPLSYLRVSADGDDVYLDATKESLKSLPEFKYNEGESMGNATMMKRNQMK